jgi:cell division protease FtsH
LSGVTSEFSGSLIVIALFVCRRAKDLVQSNIDILHKTAAVLMEKENIDGDEFQQIILESQADQYLKQDAPGVSIPYQAV